jgi:rfaE bifunctional protein nucleotidyltransferase chain/domain/rfaE bifunctional protein kinase chain/domain
MAHVNDRRRLADLVAGWQESRVVVVGDSFIDEWWYGEPERLSREAPIPVLGLGRVERAPGGAANAAVNIAALGGRPLLVAPIGDDADGAWLRGCLGEAGVDVDPIVSSGATTAVKRRVIAGGQIVLRVDTAVGRASSATAQDVIAFAEAAVDGAAVAVVVCDYAMGGLSEGFLAWLKRGRESLPFLAVDAHHLGRWRDARPDLVKPSFAEAADLIHAGDIRADDLHAGDGRLSTIEHHAELILDRSGATVSAVTLDLDGALVLGRHASPVRTSTRQAPESHAVGAGDAYLAAITLALASGAGLDDAATLAQLAADASIRGPRTCVTQVDSLLTELGMPSMPGDDRDEVLARIHAARSRGARLVFTNGCFDVLHHGHVGFLRQARELGDLLVVGLNSDASVARLKGPGRPVNGIDDRSAVLTALSCVDHVVVFDEDSPVRLINEIRPDVYVKGGDYHADLVPEADAVRRLGGDVRILDYLPDRSTSSIIERIRSSAPAGEREEVG